MANRIKWNIRAFQEIRRKSEVDDMLQGVVDDILAELPEGYEGAVTAGKTRSRGGVWTRDFEAILDNDRNQSLLRSLSNQRVGG